MVFHHVRSDLLSRDLLLDQIDYLWKRRVCILHQLDELSLEPTTRNWCVRQSTCQVIAIQLIAGIRWVAHPVEAFASRVIGTLRNEGTGSIRLSRRLHPYEGIDACNRVDGRPFTDARTILIAPVTLVNALIDPSCHYERTEVSLSLIHI